MDMIIQFLVTARRRWCLRAVVQGATASVIAAASTWLILNAAWNTPLALSLTTAVLIISLIGVLIWCLARRPSMTEIANLADSRFGLQNRLVAALEAISPESADQVKRALLNDAKVHVARLDVRQMVPIPWVRCLALISIAAGAISVSDWLFIPSDLTLHGAQAPVVTEPADESIAAVRHVILLLEEQALIQGNSELQELAEMFGQVNKELEAGMISTEEYRVALDNLIQGMEASASLTAALGLTSDTGDDSSRFSDAIADGELRDLTNSLSFALDSAAAEFAESNVSAGMEQLTLEALRERLEVLTDLTASENVPSPQDAPAQAEARERERKNQGIVPSGPPVGDSAQAQADYFDNPELRLANEQIQRNIARQKEAAAASIANAAFNSMGGTGTEAGTSTTDLAEGQRGADFAAEGNEQMLLPNAGIGASRHIELHVPKKTSEDLQATSPDGAEVSQWAETTETGQSPRRIAYGHRSVLARYFMPAPTADEASAS